MKSLIKTLKFIYRAIPVYVLRATAKLLAKPLDIHGRTLIIAPHPDDEVLGCAGLIQRLVKEQEDVHVLIMTGGEASHTGCCNIEHNIIKSERRQLSKKALGELGVIEQHIYFLNFTDGDISFSDKEQVIQLRHYMEQINPTNILVPRSDEGWKDHIETNRLITSIAHEEDKYSVYEYCVWFWFYYDWIINWKDSRILQLNSDEHQQKITSINTYLTPKAPCGKPWCGTLPSAMVYANRWNNEIYFNVKL